MTKSIAFHSYKGGTGKTTLAVNLASLLAKRGSRVFILDLDVYAPSLQSYFGEGVHTRIKKYFNDYIGGGCEVEDLIFDLTPTIKEYSKQGVWTVKWWQWALSIPKKNNPLLDDIGCFADVGQNGPVWFIAGTFGENKLPRRACTVPSSKAVLFPAINYEADVIQDPELVDEIDLVEHGILLNVNRNSNKFVQRH